LNNNIKVRYLKALIYNREALTMRNHGQGFFFGLLKGHCVVYYIMVSLQDSIL
jgi:hypothetical protein